MKWPIVKRDPDLSLGANFPQLVRGHKPLTLHEPISGAIGLTTLLTSWFASISAGGAVTVATAGTVAAASAVGGALVTMAIGTGLSMLSSLISSSAAKGRQSPSTRGGLLVNGHLPGEPVRVIYHGRTGGCWAYWKTTSIALDQVFGPGWSAAPIEWAVQKRNDMLHVVVGWGEGECAIDKDIEKPFFKGNGINDVSTGGTYTGATYTKHRVQIVATGTYKVSYDGGSTWGATTPIPNPVAWISLSDGVKFRFGSVTGYTPGDYWNFYAGDGVYIGDRMIYYYQDIANRSWVVHQFHSGTFTQTVDTDLQYWIPELNNPHRGTCYSYFRMKFSFDANSDIWTTIEDMSIKLKKIDVLDTRTGTTGYTRNPALIYYDFQKSDRYGKRVPTSKILTSDISAAANACDPDIVTHGGLTYTCIEDNLSAAGSEPGVGVNWTRYWAQTGSGGAAWVIATYYSSGFFFDGMILSQADPDETLKEIARNFLGFGFESNGKQRLKIWDYDTAVMTFTQMENEIQIDPSSLVISDSENDQPPDVVIAVFTNPDKNWGEDTVQYPDDSALSGLAGNINELRIELIGTISPIQAKKIAKYHYNRLRWSKRFSVLAHPKLAALEPGDIITATHAFPGWSATKLRVDTYGVMQNGLVPVVLMEESPTIYGYEVEYIPPNPNPNPPGPGPTTDPSPPTGLTSLNMVTYQDYSLSAEFVQGDLRFTSPDASYEYIIELRLQAWADDDVRSITYAIPKGTDAGDYVYKHVMLLTTNTGYKWRAKTVDPMTLKESAWSAYDTFTTPASTVAPMLTTFQFVEVQGWVDIIVGGNMAFQPVTYFWYWRWGTSLSHDGDIFFADPVTGLYTHDYAHLNTRNTQTTGNHLMVPCVFTQSTLYVSLVMLNANSVISSVYDGSWVYDPSIYTPPYIPPTVTEDPEVPGFPIGSITNVIGYNSGVIDVCESADNWEADMIAVIKALAVNDADIDDQNFNNWNVIGTDLDDWTEIAGTWTLRENTEYYTDAPSLKMVCLASSNHGVYQLKTLGASAKKRLFIRYKGDANYVWLYDSLTNVSLNSAGAWVAGTHSIALAAATDWTDLEIWFTTHADYANYYFVLGPHLNGANPASTTYFDLAGINAVVDETTDANDAGADDFPLMGATPQVDDCIYICGRDVPYRRMEIDISTADAAGVYTNLWEYWNGTIWKTFDPSAYFSVVSYLAVANRIQSTASIPTDWVSSTIDGTTGYWTRIRVTSFTSQAAQALASRIFVEAFAVYTESRTGFFRGGNSAIRVDIPTIAGSEDCWVKTIDLDKFSQKPQTNLVSDGTYHYWSSRTSVWESELRVFRFNFATREKKMIALGLVNSYPQSCVIDSANEYLYVLSKQGPAQIASGTRRPQITRIRLSDFTAVNTLTLNDVDIGVNSNTVSDAGWQSNYSINNHRMYIVGNVLYFPWLKANTTSHCYVTLNEVNLDTFTFKRSTVTTYQQHAGSGAVVVTLYCDATYLYLFPTNAGDDLKVKRFLLSTMVEVDKSDEDVTEALWAGGDASYFYLAYGNVSIDRLDYTAWPTVTTTSGPAAPAGYTYLSWTFDLNATHVYAPLWKDAATAPKLDKITIATWLSAGTCALAAVARGIIIGVHVGTNYIHTVSDPTFSTGTAAYVDRTYLSDFTTTYGYPLLKPDFSKADWVKCFFATTQLRDFKIGFGETVVSEQWAWVRIPKHKYGKYVERLWSLKGIGAIYRDAITYFGISIPSLSLGSVQSIWIDPPIAIDYLRPSVTTLDGLQEIAMIQDVHHVEDYINKNVFIDQMNDSSYWNVYTGANAGIITFNYDDTAMGGVVAAIVAAGTAIGDYEGMYKILEPYQFFFPCYGKDRTYTKLVFAARFRLTTITNTSGHLGFWVSPGTTVGAGTGIMVYWTTAVDSNMYGRIINAGTSTTAALLALDTAYHEIRIEMTATEVSFYVDGVFVESLTTVANIPTGLILTANAMVKTITAAGKSIFIDWIYAGPEERN